MANDLLINAIRAAGLDTQQIADIVAVDPKKVERWIAGRIPHPRYRSLLATSRGVSEAELWPETARRRGRKGLEEITGAWARRDDPDAPDWRALVRDAQTRVDLIGYSLLSLIETPGGPDALTTAAQRGIRIRIAVADPAADYVLAADLAGKQPGRLLARISTATERLTAIAPGPGIEVRQHRVATSHTILRFDDQLLLTVHLHGTPGIHAPQLHLRRQRDYGIFDQIAGHIEDLWNTAQPITAAEPEPPVPEPPSVSAADQLLDQLDNIWRPNN